MKKIIIFDPSSLLAAEVEGYMMLSEHADEMDVMVYSDSADIASVIAQEKPDEIVVSCSLLDSYPDWDYDIPVRTYARTLEQVKKADELNLACFGVTKSSSSLLDCIAEDRVLKVVDKKNPAEKKEQVEDKKDNKRDDDFDEFDEFDEPKKQPSKQRQEEARPVQRERSKEPRQEREERKSPQKEAPQQKPERNDRQKPNKPKERVRDNREYDDDDYYDEDRDWEGERKDRKVNREPERRERPRQSDKRRQDYDDDYYDYSEYDNEEEYDQDRDRNYRYDERSRGSRRDDPYRDDDRPRKKRPRDDYYDDDREDDRRSRRRSSSYEDDDEFPEEPRQRRKSTNLPYDGGARYENADDYDEAKASRRQRENKSNAMQRKLQEAKEAEERNSQNDIEHLVDEDLGNVKKPAKIITVYSAKGGVGKTTIACELATFLALTNHGKDNFRVCIADYNIDFGDVLQSLSFDPTKACMTMWADDIRERMAKGADPADIEYSEEEILQYLQRDKSSGLYALIAPIHNEDSMDITEAELNVMLRNLQNNARFDFLVCDTGNNTRDSSVIAMEMADDILLILTQSINTANCNDGALSTLNKIGFDMTKFKLVINKVKKGLGITPNELKEAIVNPKTRVPYECIGMINDTDAVRSASNNGEPLVYNSSHEFTKSIGQIASYEIGEDFVLQAPKKKSFFARLFHK